MLRISPSGDIIQPIPPRSAPIPGGLYKFDEIQKAPETIAADLPPIVHFFNDAYGVALGTHNISIF